MKKVVFASLLALTAAMFIVPAAQADDDGKISVHGEVRARWEYLENMTDFTDSDTSSPGAVPTSDNDDIDIFPYRVRVGVNGEFSDNVSAYIEVQNFGAFGDTFPYSGEADSPAAQTFGLNAFTNETDLYQGYVNLKDIGGSNFSLRIGRQEHTLGNELHMGDDDFYNGRSFDGLRGMFDFESWDLDLFYYVIAERNVVPGALLGGSGEIPNGESDDAFFWGGTANFELPLGELEPYVLYYREGNEGGNIATFSPKYNTLTIGALWDRAPSDDSAFDWSVEFAFQTGDYDGMAPAGSADNDISASIFEGWFGWSFGNGHRIHVGALVQSDGDDPMDIEGFIPLFPDTHANNRLGDSDLIANFAVNPFTLVVSGPTSTFHNITNYNVGWDWKNLSVSYHKFMLSEDFGGAEDDLGDEWNISYDYDYSNPHMGFQVGLAMFSPGDLFEAFDPVELHDDAMRFWVQSRLRF